MVIAMSEVFGEYKDVSDDTFRGFSFLYVRSEVEE